MIVAKGIGRADELLELAGKDAALPDAARRAARVLAGQIEDLGTSLAGLEAEITSAHAQNETARLLIEVPGIGQLIASATVKSVPDPGLFKPARDFAAWLGLTPRQNSSGGKPMPGAISKQGNRYIRNMLVLGGAIAVSDCAGAAGAMASKAASIWPRAVSAVAASS